MKVFVFQRNFKLLFFWSPVKFLTEISLLGIQVLLTNVNVSWVPPDFRNLIIDVLVSQYFWTQVSQQTALDPGFPIPFSLKARNTKIFIIWLMCSFLFCLLLTKICILYFPVFVKPIIQYNIVTRLSYVPSW